MKPSNLKTGNFYVNETRLFIRQILRIDGLGRVTYRDFLASTGHPLYLRAQCQKQSFGRWATREATAEESARCDLAASDRDKAELDRKLFDEINEILDEMFPDQERFDFIKRVIDETFS